MITITEDTAMTAIVALKILHNTQLDAGGYALSPEAVSATEDALQHLKESLGLA